MATLIRYRPGHPITKGSFVADIQILLNNESRLSFSAYPPLVEDGAFGLNTKARVEEWQMFNGLKVDGIVGPNTWSKMFHDTMPIAVSQAVDAAAESAVDAATNTRKKGYLYLFDSSIMTDTLWENPHQRRASRHPREDCYYHIIVPSDFSSGLSAKMGDFVDQCGIDIGEIILLSHSGGNGRLSLAGNSPYLGGNSVSMFRDVKDRLLPGAIIWIFGCSFAANRDNIVGADHDAIYPDELGMGDGISAMVDIARYTGAEVRAGLTSQTSNLNHFHFAWVSVKPSGMVRYHLKGRDLSFGEWITLLRDMKDGYLAYPLIEMMYGFEHAKKIFQYLVPKKE